MERVSRRQRRREQNSTFIRQPANANSWESNPRLEPSREPEETRRQPAREKSPTKRPQNQEQKTRKQLEEAKQKPARQTNLKELSITKEKDIRDEFESMNTFMIATEARNNTKKTMKKELHHEFEQAKVAHRSNQEHLHQEIQPERRNNAAPQQEPEQPRGPRHT